MKIFVISLFLLILPLSVFSQISIDGYLTMSPEVGYYEKCNSRKLKNYSFTLTNGFVLADEVYIGIGLGVNNSRWSNPDNEATYSNYQIPLFLRFKIMLKEPGFFVPYIVNDIGANISCGTTAEGTTVKDKHFYYQRGGFYIHPAIGANFSWSKKRSFGHSAYIQLGYNCNHMIGRKESSAHSIANWDLRIGFNFITTK